MFSPYFMLNILAVAGQIIEGTIFPALNHFKLIVSGSQHMQIVILLHQAQHFQLVKGKDCAALLCAGAASR